MEFEDIIKKIQLLDDQQRKVRTELSELGARVTGLNTNITALTKQFKGVDQQVNDLKVAAARIEQFDQILSRHRTDIARTIENVEKNSARREQETAKAHQTELEEIRKALHELRQGVAADQAARKERSLDEQRRIAAMQDMNAAVEAAMRLGRQALEAHAAMEEGRRQDVKRLADLQAELASVRKKADDAREKSALHSDSVRNVENRINELLETEAGRNERHAALLQQQALQQVERDRAWKDWHERYEAFKAQATTIENQVASFDDAVRAARQAQEAYDGLNQRLERRISEVGEIQRLADERIRQEWIAFKADEQKRWTGHTLAQDESIRELRKDVDVIEKRVAGMDESTQMMQDQLEQTTETTEKQLQELMNISQEWLAAYERIMGHTKNKAQRAVR